MAGHCCIGRCCDIRCCFEKLPGQAATAEHVFDLTGLL